MNLDFEFKQILRAYRAGIIDEATFEQELQSLENGSASSQNGFRAFGSSYASEREAYHGRAFERRLMELGGTMPNRQTEELRKNLAYLGNPSISDYQKLHRGATRFPNPDETIRPLFEFAAQLKEDLQTKEMVQLFAQDELSTLKWQNALCATLTRMQGKTSAAAAS